MNRTYTEPDGYTITITTSEMGHTSIHLIANGRKSPGSMISSYTKVEPVTQKPYIEGLRKLGKDPRQYRCIAGIVIRSSAVPFIESVLAELRAERDDAKARLARNVPGLEQLRDARADEDRYHREFEAMMSDESNDGARPPRDIKARYEDLAAKYPVAAAYLKADGWEGAGHYAKAAAGRRAKARIAAGEDHEQVLRDMEAEWSAHVAEHAWD